MSSLPCPERRGCDAAVKAAQKAQAAKLAIDSALDSAGKSVKSAFKAHVSLSFTVHGQFGTGPKALWKQLSTGRSGSHRSNLDDALAEAGVPRNSDAKHLEEEDDNISLPPSETSMSTTASSSRPCSGIEGESFERDGDSQVEDELTFPDDEGMHQRWESALQGRQPSDLAPEEVRQLVRCGMPLKYRLQFWPQWLSAKEVTNADQLHHCVPANIAHQIDLDVPRTRSRLLGEPDRVTLLRVLRAYAMHDPVVGYCQGMGDIAAVFVLLGFDEPTVLCGLCSMVQACCPDYFCPSLRGYVRDMAVLEVLVRELLPAETVQRLDRLGVPLRTLAADHFLTLASHTWPLGAVVRLWDLFLLEGSRAVFASFLTLLQLYLPEEKQGHCGKDRPSCAEGPEQVEAFVNAVSGGAAADIDKILDRTWELIPSIPMSRIESLRYVFSA